MNYDDIIPGDVYRETGRWFGPALVVGLAVVVLAAILTLVGWQVGWWFAAHNVDRQNRVYQGSYGAQTADIDTMQNAIGAIAAASDKAQQRADVNEACRYAAKITAMPAADAGWVRQNCLAGAMSPTSPYAK